MKRAVLLPNMVEFPSESMKRYAAELMGGLQDLHSRDWEFSALECHHVERPVSFLPPGERKKMAIRLGMFVRYPRMARRAAGDSRTNVFHVLDHSHANLTRSLNGDKSVLTCHDIIPFLAAKGLIPMTAGRAIRYTFPQRIRAMKRCRYIITISESSKRDLIEHAGVPEEQIVVIYFGINKAFHAISDSGVDPVERRAELLRQHGLPEDARVMLHVGTATRYKNTPAVLKALQRLRGASELSDTVYLLRIGAPFFDDEEALIDELKVRDRIAHVGRGLSDSLLADYYRAADVFVFPSIWEGFGLPPVEAMACGTPVVTSNVSALPEAVGEGGIVVAPQDIDAFTDGIHRILTQSDLRSELRVKGLAQAAKFTWNRCALDTLAVYDKITSANAVASV